MLELRAERAPERMRRWVKLKGIEVDSPPDDDFVVYVRGKDLSHYQNESNTERFVECAESCARRVAWCDFILAILYAIALIVVLLWVRK